jgi:hypothetical protein
MPVHIDYILLTRCTGHAAKWLLGEHGILLVLRVLLLARRHEEIVKVLELLFQQFEGLLGVLLIRKLLCELVQDLVDTLEQKALEILQGLNVCFPIETVLEVPKQLTYLIPQCIKLMLQPLQLPQHLLHDGLIDAAALHNGGGVSRSWWWGRPCQLGEPHLHVVYQPLQPL